MKKLLLLSIVFLMNATCFAQGSAFQLSEKLKFIFHVKERAMGLYDAQSGVIHYAFHEGQILELEITKTGHLKILSRCSGIQHLSPGDLVAVLEDLYQDLNRALTTDFKRNGAILQQFYRNLLNFMEPHQLYDQLIRITDGIRKLKH